MNNVDWFVNEIIKLEKKMNFYFKNILKKDIVMSQEDEENYKNNYICWFCEQEILDNTKVRDHCHLTGQNIEDQLIIIVI